MRTRHSVNDTLAQLDNLDKHQRQLSDQGDQLTNRCTVSWASFSMSKLRVLLNRTPGMLDRLNCAHQFDSCSDFLTATHRWYCADGEVSNAMQALVGVNVVPFKSYTDRPLGMVRLHMMLQGVNPRTLIVKGVSENGRASFSESSVQCRLRLRTI